jgi:hypothetical protein
MGCEAGKGLDECGEERWFRPARIPLRIDDEEVFRCPRRPLYDQARASPPPGERIGRPSNRRVRSRFTPPERRKFEPRAGSALPNMLNFLTPHNLTKMAVVQLRRRKLAKRGQKRPEVTPQAGRRGSDNFSEVAAVRGLQGAIQTLKQNVPTGETGGGRGGAVVKPSLVAFQMFTKHTN